MWESDLYFHQLSPEDRTLVIKFDSRHHLSHHTSPRCLLLNFLWNGTTDSLTISLIKVLGEDIYRTLAVSRGKVVIGENGCWFVFKKVKFDFLCIPPRSALFLHNQALQQETNKHLNRCRPPCTGLLSTDSAVIMESEWEVRPRGQALKHGLVYSPRLASGEGHIHHLCFIEKENGHRAVNPLVHGLTALKRFTWDLNLRQLNLETAHTLSSKPIGIQTRKA